jgi:halocyanin-like protein
VDDVVLKALEKRKEDRYEGILLLRREIDRLFEEYVSDGTRGTGSGGFGVGSGERGEGTGTEESSASAPTASGYASSDSEKRGTKSVSKEEFESKTGDHLGSDEDGSPVLTRRRMLGLLGAGAVGGAGWLVSTQMGGDSEPQDDGGGSSSAELQPDQSGETNAGTEQTQGTPQESQGGGGGGTQSPAVTFWDRLWFTVTQNLVYIIGGIGAFAIAGAYLIRNSENTEPNDSIRDDHHESDEADSPFLTRRRALGLLGAGAVGGAGWFVSTQIGGNSEPQPQDEGGGGTAELNPSQSGGGTDTTAGQDGNATDMTGQSEVTVDVGAGLRGFKFDPADITIDGGTTVRWVWSGRGSQHNVVEGDGAEVADDPSFESELTAEEGHEFAHTFEEAGTYDYVCSVHLAQDMVGSIEVEGGDGGGEIDGGMTESNEGMTGNESM